jgi:hypothetical protein
MRRLFWLPPLFLALALALVAAAPPAAPTVKEKVLFDFEDPNDLKAWSNLDLPDAGAKEPPVQLQLSDQHAITSAKQFGTACGGRPPGLPGQTADPEVCRHEPRGTFLPG